MSTSASIYQMIRPTESPNLLSQALQAENLVQARRSGRMSDMQMDEYNRGIQSKNKLQELLGGQYADDAARESALIRGGFIDQAGTLQKNRAEAAKAQSELTKDKAEVFGKYFSTAKDIAGRVMANPTPESAAQALDFMENIGKQLGLDVSKDMQAQRQGLMQMTSPEQIKQWAAGHALQAEKLLPQIQNRNIGGQDQTVAIDPLTGKPTVTGTVQRTQSPDSVASVQATIRGQNMSDARARERLAFEQAGAVADQGGPSQVALTKLFGKAEPGRRWKPDGTLEAIPGGSADRKLSDAGIKEERQREGAIQQANRVVSKVDEALKKVGYTTAGAGSVLADVPGTPARDLRSTLETIKANLGFAELQAMRDASPTGGALGAIAVQELTALQSTVASLDQAQSPAKLAQSLNDINRHYTNWKEAVSGRQPTNPKPAPQNPSTVNPGNPRLNTTTPGRLKYDAQGNLIP